MHCVTVGLRCTTSKDHHFCWHNKRRYSTDDYRASFFTTRESVLLARSLKKYFYLSLHQYSENMHGLQEFTLPGFLKKDILIVRKYALFSIFEFGILHDLKTSD